MTLRKPPPKVLFQKSISNSSEVNIHIFSLFGSRYLLNSKYFMLVIKREGKWDFEGRD